MLELDALEIVLQGGATLKAVYRAGYGLQSSNGARGTVVSAASTELLMAMCDATALKLLTEDQGYKYYLVTNRVLEELPPGNRFKLILHVKESKPWSTQ